MYFIPAPNSRLPDSQTPTCWLLTSALVFRRIQVRHAIRTINFDRRHELEVHGPCDTVRHNFGRFGPERPSIENRAREKLVVPIGQPLCAAEGVRIGP